MSKHTDWWENLMKENGRCAACEQDDYMNSPDRTAEDFEAMQPSSYQHNTDAFGCKRNPARTEEL